MSLSPHSSHFSSFNDSVKLFAHSQNKSYITCSFTLGNSAIASLAISSLSVAPADSKSSGVHSL